MFQAIVPAYTFQCSGRVTQWRACVQPGGTGNSEEYYIQFQVWRPTGIDGCYERVGYNTPLDGDESVAPNSVMTIGIERLLIAKGGGAPDHCVVLPVKEDKQIEFQSGDVIGYYVDYFRNGEDRDNGGIQWIDNDEIIVFHRDNLPREHIKSQYALSMSPSVCSFEISPETSALHALGVTSDSAPIISLSITISVRTIIATIVSPTWKPGLLPSPSSSPTGLAMVSTTTTPSATPSSSTILTTGLTSVPPSSPTPTGDDTTTLIIVGVVLVIFILALSKFWRAHYLLCCTFSCALYSKYSCGCWWYHHFCAY